MAGIPSNKVRNKGKIEQHEHCDVADAKRVKVVDEVGNAINDSNPLPVNATFSGASKAKNPIVVEVEMAVAETEYSYTFPLNTDQFIIRPLLDKYSIEYYFISGSTTTMTLYPGNSLETGDIKLGGTTTIYFKCEAANTVKIQLWTL